MEQREKVELQANLYRQIWSSKDMKPDRVTAAMNKIFALDKNDSNVDSKDHRRFRFDQSQAESNSKEMSWETGGSILSLAKAKMKVGGKFQTAAAEDSKNATDVSWSQNEVSKWGRERDIEVAWDGEKLYAKSFLVYRLAEIIDQMETTFISKEMTADKSRKPTFRTITSRDTPKSVPVGLFPGEIRLYTSTTVPPPFNWLVCDGEAVSREEYPRLFHVIGITYGSGDGQTTFNLPDLRSRFPLGLDASRNQTDYASQLGYTGGQSSHRMSVEHLPSHTHDQGTLLVGQNGSHTHISSQPVQKFSTIDLIPHDNDPATLHFIRGSDSDLLSNVTLQALKISLLTHNTSLNVVQDHIHHLNGTSGMTGGGQQFSIINPFQVVQYIIYAG